MKFFLITALFFLLFSSTLSTITLNNLEDKGNVLNADEKTEIQAILDSIKETGILPCILTYKNAATLKEDYNLASECKEDDIKAIKCLYDDSNFAKASDSFVYMFSWLTRTSSQNSRSNSLTDIPDETLKAATDAADQNRDKGVKAIMVGYLTVIQKYLKENPPKKKNPDSDSGFIWIILLIVFALLAIGAAGYYFYNKSKVDEAEHTTHGKLI